MGVMQRECINSMPQKRILLYLVLLSIRGGNAKARHIQLEPATPLEPQHQSTGCVNGILTMHGMVQGHYHYSHNRIIDQLLILPDIIVPMNRQNQHQLNEYWLQNYY